eukprot:CAMPEP_0204913120 /NCGR_PEP_ID=MMETSP1397-20131031/11124_1 /ASSEMBLY_ACC=CAM_ASM_000891 /TAXON_ID=49980 /ORGANISM="Climacostomum Climacostomum virens, Strain Stock W-24" /LENGTH=472 /DNA_ID=CAMNT_0052084309 /DNA_START=153 /DNA_END=1571 /DNA_ORIENTATION=-
MTAQEPGFIEAEEGEKTHKVKQSELKALLPTYNSRLIFDLDLNFGPYELDYTQNGTNMLLGGRQGHIALLKWKEGKILTEFNVKELVRDVKFLHNELLFAVAQRKSVYIYDSQGIEVHYLKTHIEPVKIEFLPYHFLLVTANNYGFMKYLDVSTGKQIAEHRWRWEAVQDLKANPWNAVVNVADSRGVVSMWAPSIGKPLARLVCHNGPVNAIAIDKRGLYLATAGSDMKLKVFDVRRLGDPLFEYWLQSPAKSLDISQSGLLAVNQGPEAVVWRDWYSVKQTAPYMRHKAATAVNDLHFVPYEDFLGVGLVGGFSSISVPGSGFANYDTFEANPFESKRQRQEKEVHSLLEKLQPETIIMNPQEFGTVDKAAPEIIEAEMKAEQAQRERAEEEKRAEKKKKKKSSTKEKKKRKESVYDAKTRKRIKEKIRESSSAKRKEVEQIAQDLQVLSEELKTSEDWTVHKRIKLDEE